MDKETMKVIAHMKLDAMKHLAGKLPAAAGEEITVLHHGAMEAVIEALSEHRSAEPKDGREIIKSLVHLKLDFFDYLVQFLNPEAKEKVLEFRQNLVEAIIESWEENANDSSQNSSVTKVFIE